MSEIFVYITDYFLKEDEKQYQTEHRVGLSLLARGLREQYGLVIEEAAFPNELEYGAHGKPFLKHYPDIHFNISHCEKMAACGFSDAPIGIDIERFAEFREALVKKVLTEEEQQYLRRYESDKQRYQELFYRFWTLKESYLKWDGRGFAKNPREVSFQLQFADNKILEQILCSDAQVGFYQKRVGNQSMLSVCGKQLNEQKDCKIVEI